MNKFIPGVSGTSPLTLCSPTSPSIKRGQMEETKFTFSGDTCHVFSVFMLGDIFVILVTPLILAVWCRQRKETGPGDVIILTLVINQLWMSLLLLSCSGAGLLFTLNDKVSNPHWGHWRYNRKLKPLKKKNNSSYEFIIYNQYHVLSLKQGRMAQSGLWSRTPGLV